MEEDNKRYLIIADNKYYAIKQGLPDAVTYEQKITWIQDKEIATKFPLNEAEWYMERFNNEIGDEHRIEMREFVYDRGTESI